ncbi:MAG: NAD-dependent epimerase/dehydratase family protein [Solirubrobacteraceae bacterium]|nr:NAD-dependent epimerase/dehydratase family protein [Solirubrobacteraceae bacterium]
MLLVTGGSGFIGSHIVDALAAAGRSVRILDHHAPTAPVPGGVDVQLGDVRDPATVATALDGVTAVCHQAAMVGLGVDLDYIADYVSHNDLGTAVLLKAMAARVRAGHGPSRLVLASSMVVYGEGRYRCAEHGLVAPGPRETDDLEGGRFEPPCPVCGAPLTPEPVPETAPADPRNVYAATKLQQEHLATAFSRETGLPVTALRYHNVYGPRMPRDTPYAGVASLFSSELAAGRPPRVFEDGGQLRDFVHVRDISHANVLALTAEEPVPGAFNVCSGTPRSVLDMARALHAAAATGTPEPVIAGGYRLGDVRHVFADATRAREVLGFTAREPFTEGMAELFAGETRPAG